MNITKLSPVFRYPALIAAVTAICSLLWSRPVFSNTILPPLPTLPQVGFGNPLSALRVSMSGSVSAFSFDPPGLPAFGGFGQNSTSFVETGNYEEFLHETGAEAAHSETTSANAAALGTAAFGKLAALATASNTAGGLIDAKANVHVDFIDMFEVGPGQSVSLEALLALDGSASAEVGFGSAAGAAAVWIFPFGPLPPPGNRFFGQAYRSRTRTVGSPDQITHLGTLQNLPPNSKWWVYAQLRAEASRVVQNINHLDKAGTSVAGFGNTAQLFINPAPGFEDAVYFSASGFDYRTPPPVPEPTSVTLLCIGLLGFITRRRPRA